MTLEIENNEYILNGKFIGKIHGIESITQDEAEYLIAELHGEKFEAKEHVCYLVDLAGFFGYSLLVFKNEKHIHYVNDYELHNTGKSHAELKTKYMNRVNNLLFTDDELMSDIKTYDEYTRKDYYVRNYWIMRYDGLSIFYIGDPNEERIKLESQYPYYSPVCFKYVKEKVIVEQSIAYIKHIDAEFEKLKKNDAIFRTMIAYELSNHEACITCDATSALRALGLSWNNLSDTQRRIVKQELKKQIQQNDMLIA